MSFRWHPEALDEFYDASLFYRSRRIGLDERFENCIQDAIDSIVLSPRGWPYCEEPARCRVVDDVFPYSIIYVDLEQYVLIYAVMHHSREPGYWMHRLD
jgi:toxin ParE1/3/4